MPRARTGPKPRTNPSGSVIWTEQIDVGPDPETGKRRVRRVSAPTLEECALLAAQVRLALRRERERPDAPSPGKRPAAALLTLRATVERTLARMERTAGRPGSLRMSTVQSYRAIVTRQLIEAAPALAAMPLAEVRLVDLQRHYDARAEVVSSGYLRILHNVLRQAMRDAIVHGDLTVSPLDGIRLPRLTATEHTVWNAIQARAFRETMERLIADPLSVRPRWRQSAARAPIFLLLLVTGMRIGEARALRWGDVTLTAGEASVWVRRTASVNLARAAIETATKTASGRRRIAIGDAIAGMLRTIHTQQERDRAAGLPWTAPASPDGDLVFPGDHGHLLTADFAKSLRWLCREAGVPALRPHGIRHTCGTLLAASGANPKAISQLLGHADVTITLRLYVHPDQNELRSVATVLDGFSAGSAEGVVSSP